MLKFKRYMDGTIAKRVATFLMGMMLVLPAGLQAACQLPVVNVAIVTDGSSERVAALRALFLEEMRAINRGEFDIQAPPNLQLETNRRDIYRWSIVLKGSSLLCELKINNDN